MHKVQQTKVKSSQAPKNRDAVSELPPIPMDADAAYQVAWELGNGGGDGVFDPRVIADAWEGHGVAVGLREEFAKLLCEVKDQIEIVGERPIVSESDIVDSIDMLNLCKLGLQLAEDILRRGRIHPELCGCEECRPTLGDYLAIKNDAFDAFAGLTPEGQAVCTSILKAMLESQLEAQREGHPRPHDALTVIILEGVARSGLSRQENLSVLHCIRKFSELGHAIPTPGL